MPRQAIERLNKEMIRIIRSPELRARLLEAGAEVMTSTPLQTTEFIAKDRVRWANVIKRAGTQLEGTN
jgi:tripartite-type tricarboxylate transporter receptor subunit TctC